MPPFALDPQSFVRSVDATRATVGMRRMKLIDVVARTQALTPARDS
jgi:hypothetical protein